MNNVCVDNKVSVRCTLRQYLQWTRTHGPAGHLYMADARGATVLVDLSVLYERLLDFVMQGPGVGHHRFTYGLWHLRKRTQERGLNLSGVYLNSPYLDALFYSSDGGTVDSPGVWLLHSDFMDRKSYGRICRLLAYDSESVGAKPMLVLMS